MAASELIKAETAFAGRKELAKLTSQQTLLYWQSKAHAIPVLGLWACLAGFAVAAGELTVAETAFAGCEEVDKLQYMAYIRQLPSREARLAELALYRHNATEAEAILLQVCTHCLLPAPAPPGVAQTIQTCDPWLRIPVDSFTYMCVFNTF